MEITAPGGDLEKVICAIDYGADAVYCGFQKYGLRATATNLNEEQLSEAIAYAHLHDKKLYLTLNAYLKNKDFTDLKEFIQWLSQTGIDAVIVSDPGVFSLVKKYSNIPIHISTQANITNIETARFWLEAGAKRIVPARELSFQEISEIKTALPALEIECFIHGAMCVAFSGRCLLSAHLNNKSANSGACTQPCRWNWALTEESRPGEYFPIEEDQYGSYILSSKDICLYTKMPMLKASGITAGKIEGRMKSIYYVAQICRIYALARNTQDVATWDILAKELEKVSHRPYWEGFYDFPNADAGIVSKADSSAYISEMQYIGKVDEHSSGRIRFHALAKISLGDTIDIIYPDMKQDFSHRIEQIYDTEGNLVTSTRPNFDYYLDVPIEQSSKGIIRKCVNTS